VGKSRLEAFSDGVLAIVLTIMVLEMKVPHSPAIEALWPLFGVFLSYLLSFIYVGIYWSNHHHLLHTVHKVTGGILWANLHLLFWLSLVPFVTGWMGENHFAAAPTALYGLVLLLSGLAFKILAWTILAAHGEDSLLARALGNNDWKTNVSLAIYVLAVAVAFWHPATARVLYAAVALLWLVPDRRIERLFD